MTLDQGLQIIAKYLKTIKDPVERVAVAYDLLGKNAANHVLDYLEQSEKGAK